MILLVLIALTSHNFLAFFNLEGLIIVVGGVIAVAFMSFDSADVHLALQEIARMFKEQKRSEDRLYKDVTVIIYCARLLRQHGLRDLESVIKKSGISDPFIKYGLAMVVSDYVAADVRTMLETAAEAHFERESVPVDVLQAMASHAPAFGMVGTLVGMVAMLCTLGDTIAGVGPTLAVSFVSTLYGVLSARMVYIPAASKLRQKVADRRFRNYLITEGMVMLVENKGPMYIQDRLNSYLRPDPNGNFDVVNATRMSTTLLNLEHAA